MILSSNGNGRVFNCAKKKIQDETDTRRDVNGWWGGRGIDRR